MNLLGNWNCISVTGNDSYSQWEVGMMYTIKRTIDTTVDSKIHENRCKQKI